MIYCTLHVVSLPCLCRALLVSVPCLCRVLAVFLLSLCRVGVVCVCLCCALALDLQYFCHEVAVLLPCVGCGSSLRWVVDCSGRDCVRVRLGCACAMAVFSRCTCPVLSNQACPQCFSSAPWMGLSRSNRFRQGLRTNPRGAAKPCSETKLCDAARAYWSSPDSPASRPAG